MTYNPFFFNVGLLLIDNYDVDHLMNDIYLFKLGWQKWNPLYCVLSLILKYYKTKNIISEQKQHAQSRA